MRLNKKIIFGALAFAFTQCVWAAGQKQQPTAVDQASASDASKVCKKAKGKTAEKASSEEIEAFTSEREYSMPIDESKTKIRFAKSGVNGAVKLQVLNSQNSGEWSADELDRVTQFYKGILSTGPLTDKDVAAYMFGAATMKPNDLDAKLRAKVLEILKKPALEEGLLCADSVKGKRTFFVAPIDGSKPSMFSFELTKNELTKSDSLTIHYPGNGAATENIREFPTASK